MSWFLPNSQINDMIIKKNKKLIENNDWITIMFPPERQDKNGLTFFQRMKILHDELYANHNTKNIAKKIQEAYMDCL
jgi:hypothetical protein